MLEAELHYIVIDWEKRSDFDQVTKNFVLSILNAATLPEEKLVIFIDSTIRFGLAKDKAISCIPKDGLSAFIVG